MARTLTRETLYETDYLAWIEEQAGHLRAGRWQALDAPNIAEELDDMGRREREELYNRLEVLLIHLLKWDHQPRRRSRSWQATIADQRRRLRRRLRLSPSLKNGLEETLREAYEGALEQAGIETGLGSKTFPPTNPYTPVQIFGFDPFE